MSLMFTTLSTHQNLDILTMVSGIGCFVSTTITLLVRITVTSGKVQSVLNISIDLLPPFNHQGNRVQSQTSNNRQFPEKSSNHPTHPHVRTVRISTKLQWPHLNTSRNGGVVRRRRSIRILRRASICRHRSRPRGRAIWTTRCPTSISTPTLPSFFVQPTEPRSVILTVNGYDSPTGFS